MPNLPTKKDPAMPNVTNQTPHHNPKIEVFSARCKARAMLWAWGELNLHDAVDFLQRQAADYGLDTDVAQRIMADAFESRRKST
jgi:hypothetical protein